MRPWQVPLNVTARNQTLLQGKRLKAIQFFKYSSPTRIDFYFIVSKNNANTYNSNHKDKIRGKNPIDSDKLKMIKTSSKSAILAHFFRDQFSSIMNLFFW
jgi:hypothetical protein